MTFSRILMAFLGPFLGHFLNLLNSSQDNYVPEDLISLLDAGINADNPSVIIDADAMFSDDAMFGYSQAR